MGRKTIFFEVSQVFAECGSCHVAALLLCVFQNVVTRCGVSAFEEHLQRSATPEYAEPLGDVAPRPPLRPPSENTLRPQSRQAPLGHPVRGVTSCLQTDRPPAV